MVDDSPCGDTQGASGHTEGAGVSEQACGQDLLANSFPCATPAPPKQVALPIDAHVVPTTDTHQRGLALEEDVLAAADQNTYPVGINEPQQRQTPSSSPVACRPSSPRCAETNGLQTDDGDNEPHSRTACACESSPRPHSIGRSHVPFDDAKEFTVKVARETCAVGMQGGCCPQRNAGCNGLANGHGKKPALLSAHTVSVVWESQAEESNTRQVYFHRKSEYMGNEEFYSRLQEQCIQAGVTHTLVKIVSTRKEELPESLWDDPDETWFPMFCIYKPVDPNEATFCHKARRLALRVVEHKAMDAVVGAIILANACTIGIEIQQKINCELPAMASRLDVESVQRASVVDDALLQCTIVVWWLEILFTIVYTIELSLRFLARGTDCLQNNWVKADVFFVFISYLSYFMDVIFASAPAGLKQLKLLRLLRLLRLARPLRLLRFCKELWTLVSGLMRSTGIIAHTMMLIAILIYIASCLAVELVKTPTDKDLAAGRFRSPTYVQTQKTYFNSLLDTMLSLMAFIAMDGVAGIYTPLVWFARDGVERGLLVVFFCLIALIIAVVLMNLITAVVVENAMAQSADVIEERKQADIKMQKELVDEIRSVFESIDDDQSGLISYEEASLDHPSNARWKDFVDKHMKTVQGDKIESAADVFDELDLDRNFEVKIDEFVDKIKRHVTHPGPPPIQRAEIVAERMAKRMGEIDASMGDVCLRYFNHAGHAPPRKYRPLRRRELQDETSVLSPSCRPS